MRARMWDKCLCGHVFFFFSSRRRHTRCLSDWSSDVCSSDLRCCEPCPIHAESFCDQMDVFVRPVKRRSEERRVGKECRSRWSRDHEKNKKAKNKITKLRAQLIDYQTLSIEHYHHMLAS